MKQNFAKNKIEENKNSGIRLLKDREGNEFFLKEDMIQKCLNESKFKVDGFIITEIIPFKLLPKKK